MIWRNITTALFAAVLALTSVTLAVGQHAMPQGTRMVICTDLGAQTVVLDANGNPVQADHSCIDCFTATLAQDVPPALPLPMPPLAAQTQLARPADTATPSRAPLQPHARGPPLADVI